MSILITLLTVLLSTTPDDVEAFRSTAPRYLTTETAHEHLLLARVAAAEHGLDADLLLSIAWFESRYTVDVIGPEVRGKRACGVMQPMMKTACPTNPSLAGGYMQGAQHVRAWVTAARGDMRMAMLGYGGGYALINRCAEGALMVERAGRLIDLCTVADTRLYRMQAIKRARAKRTRS